MSDRAFSVAFILSLAGHCLLLGMPGFNTPLPPAEIPEETAVTLEIEKPKVLPRIDVMGDEKKLKEVKEERREPIVEPQPGEAAVEKPEEKIEVNDPDHEAMLRYQDMVRRRIEEARRYPSWAKAEGIEGSVDLSFTVLPDGTGKDITVVRSSGSKDLDAEAVSTIMRAQPFPPMAEKLRCPYARMELTVVYEIK